MSNQSTIKNWQLYLPSLLFIVGFAIYSAYWFVSASNLEEETQNWAQAQRSSGFEVRYQTLEVTGYPFRFEMRFKNFSLAQLGHPNDWVWETEDLVALMQTYRFDHIVFEATGNQRITYIEDLGPEARAPIQYDVTGTVETFQASAAYVDNVLERISIDLQNIQAIRSGGGFSQDFLADRLQFHLRPSGENGKLASGTDLYLKADKFTAPRTSRFGPRLEDEKPIDLLQAKFHLAGLGHADLFSGRGFQSWLKGGGKTDISDLALTWDTSGILGRGDLALDKKARVNGEVKLSIYGHGQIIEKLVSMNVIDRESGQLADTALSLAALISSKDGRIDAPLKFKNGKIYIGPAQIGKLGPIDVN